MLRRRREPVPPTFITKADAIRSGVRPPPRKRATAGETASRALVGILVVAGLIGAVLFGLPALEISEDPETAQPTETVNE